MRKVVTGITIIAALILSGQLQGAELAPNFVLGKNKKQQTITLKHYRGKVVYVDFWASWCPPCLNSFPWMNEMQSRYGKQGFKIVAINMDQDREEAKAFLKTQPANFHILYDPEGKIAEKYGVQAMPTAYFIDKKGRVSKEKKGFKLKDQEAMEAYVQTLLSQKL